MSFIKIEVHTVSDSDGYVYCVCPKEVDYKKRSVLGVMWKAKHPGTISRMTVTIPPEKHPLFHNESRGRPYRSGELPVLDIRVGQGDGSDSKLRFNRGMEGDGDVDFRYDVVCFGDNASEGVPALDCNAHELGVECDTLQKDDRVEPRIIVRNVSPVAVHD